jgi:hypothetical protein
MRIRHIVPVFAGALALAGCQDLVVDNENTPSLRQVFSNGEDLENAIGTTFRIVWGVAQGARTNSFYPVIGIAAMGEEFTAPTFEVLDVASEPRRPLDNRDAGMWTNRKPWYDTYEAIATTTDALISINEGLEIGTGGVHTNRAKIFARFIQGLGHTYIGLLFDKGFTRDETTGLDASAYKLKPYAEVTAFGITKLEEAIKLATDSPIDTFPAFWVNGYTGATAGVFTT